MVDPNLVLAVEMLVLAVLEAVLEVADIQMVQIQHHKVLQAAAVLVALVMLVPAAAVLAQLQQI